MNELEYYIFYPISFVSPNPNGQENQINSGYTSSNIFGIVEPYIPYLFLILIVYLVVKLFR